MLDVPDVRKHRPVLVLSRPSLLEVLATATVVAIGTERLGSPTEVDVGAKEGLKKPSCVNLVNLFTVRQSQLRRRVGSLSAAKMHRVGRALAIASGCD